MGNKSGRLIVITGFFLLVFGLSSIAKTASAAPSMTNPAPFSTLNCGNVTFNWSANGTPGITKWWLYVGTTQGGKDIFDSGVLGTSTSTTVSGIPEDGSTIYVTLWYKVGTNSWQNVKSTYTAASNCTGGGGGSSSDCPDAWSQKLPADERFEGVLPILVFNGIRFDSVPQAVLDHETCLVWEKSPDTTTRTWTSALSYCFAKKVGGRKGWRLPTVEELATLVDDTQSNPALPSGHPFDTNAVQSSWYWSSTTSAGSTALAWGVDFDSGDVSADSKAGSIYVWCVRSGQGYDGY